MFEEGQRSLRGQAGSRGHLHTTVGDTARAQPGLRAGQRTFRIALRGAQTALGDEGVKLRPPPSGRPCRAGEAGT